MIGKVGSGSYLCPLENRGAIEVEGSSRSSKMSDNGGGGCKGHVIIDL